MCLNELAALKKNTVSKLLKSNIKRSFWRATLLTFILHF